jgi:hypothetical protein
VIDPADVEIVPAFEMRQFRRVALIPGIPLAETVQLLANRRVLLVELLEVSIADRPRREQRDDQQTGGEDRPAPMARGEIDGTARVGEVDRLEPELGFEQQAAERPDAVE